MTAKIIDLHQYRSTVRSRINGVAFPQVYRIQGYYGDLEASEQEGKLMPSEVPAPIVYSLSDSDDAGLAAVTATAIRCFDPELDDGWLIVRHHMRQEFAEGYLDAVLDQYLEERPTTRTIFRTDKGIFTLSGRKAVIGRPDHLVIYITKVAEPVTGGWTDHFTIVLPDGTTSEDGDMLLPLEPEEIGDY